MDIMVEQMVENTNEKLWYSNNNLCINNRYSCVDSCFWIIMGVLKMKKIKDMWEKSYGEGTKFDLDYGKLILVFLCIYIAIKVT